MMKIINEIKYQFQKLRDKWLFKHFYLKKIKTPKKHISKTVLIIRLDAIGDCIIWLDQAKEYRKAFPNHKLLLLHNKVWSEIAVRLPWFDEFIPFDRTKIGDVKYYKRLIKKLNNYTFEKVFSPVFSRDFITVDWIVHNVNAREKIGYEGDYQNNYWIENNNVYVRKHKGKWNFKAIADSWYTFIVYNETSCVMELQRNAHYIRQTIIPNYAVLFLGASTIHRTWPVNYFATITEELPNKTILLCGSSEEKDLASAFIALYNGNKNIVDITGGTTLIELINIITNADIVITNDTSASHIAVATRTPSICFLGGGHYGRFHPYQVDSLSDDDRKALPIVFTSRNHSCFGCNWRCKYPLVNDRWRCIAEITPKDVLTTLLPKRKKINNLH